VNFGWLVRLIHSNFASVLFIFVYLHIVRGIFYNSFKYKYTWSRGFILYLLIIAAAFLGYILVWGQISLWGATVITNLITVLPYGDQLLIWFWGRFSVRGNLLKLFFTLHYITPFIILVIIIVHIILLHSKGRSDRLSNSNINKITFDKYLIVKDIYSLVIIMFIIIIILLYPDMFFDSENFIKADYIISPLHIKPEWYFLLYYGILRRIPSKTGGLVLTLLVIVAIYLLLIINSKFRIKRIPLLFYTSFSLIICICMLTWVGGLEIEYPFLGLGIILSLVLISTLLLFNLIFILPIVLY